MSQTGNKWSAIRKANVNKIPCLKKQQGVAGMGILAAMMVVVFVAAIAIKHSWRSDIDLTQAGHRWKGMQAKAYIQGAETLALIALEKDKDPSRPPIDTLNEEWAQPFDFPTDHGFMQIRIVDAQAKLNVNVLGTAYKSNNGVSINGAAKYSAEQRQFIRLLQLLPFDEDETLVTQTQAEEIMDALLDWLDPDSNVVGFGGAESTYYDQLELPYTISNGPMVSVSELRRVKGVSSTLYNALLPYVTALDTASWINANTLAQKLVQVVNYEDNLSPIDENSAEQIFQEIRGIDMEAQKDLEDTLELYGMSKAQNGPNIDSANFVYQSNWFDMNTTVTVGDTVKRYRSRIDRSGSSAKIERRSDANF